MIEDMVQLPASTLALLQRALAAQAGGPASAAEGLRRAGMDAAPAIQAQLRLRAPDLESLASDRFWARLGDLLREMGWGSFRHERLHPGVLSLASSDWFESRDARSEAPCCQFTVGVLAELFRRTADGEVAVMEVGCRGTGASECRFLIGSPAALESVYEQMADGSHYREAVASLG